MRAYLTQKSNTLSESVNYEMGEMGEMIPMRINEFMVLYDYERSTRHLFIAKNFSQHSSASVESVTGC